MEFKEGWLHRQGIAATIQNRWQDAVRQEAHKIWSIMDKGYMDADMAKATNMFIDNMIMRLEDSYVRS